MRRILLMSTLVLLPRPALAQISPGGLAKPHAKLEGSSGCLKCHDPGKGVASDRCLACHTALKQRLDAGRGLHARADYKKCETCHVDHQGRAVELVWWGKKGREAFEHRDTGYLLEGKHARLACEACHQAKYLQDAKALGQGSVDTARTYLGLGAACLACHADEHRGQFVKADCRSCHSMDAWKPASGFDHARTSYPLTGRHAPVACDKCHAAAADASGAAFRKYGGVAFQQCTSCHADAHKGRLGAACASCHTTAGWSIVQKTSFDHDKTAYPLRERHVAVACDKCHTAGRTAALRHDSCTACHHDAHRGEFAKRADKGRCEACHDVRGFTPARFGPDEHQKSAYPLAGSHLAVACDACHRRPSGQKTAGYRLTYARCTDCHKDPHKGETDKYAPKAGCETCHRVDSWRKVVFEHEATRFPLAGGHVKAACGACHKKTDVGTARERTRFTGLPLVCESCHRDVHAGQFVVAGATRCERCHGIDAWKADRFDHNRDASYRLDGAHAKVACAKCHKPEKREGRPVARYKPLASNCRDCHASGGKS
jgi:hypothetical protein